MEPVVGIFASRSLAARAAADLERAGFPKDRVELLLPIDAPTGDGHAQPPEDDAEQPGVGMALGGVVGAAAGASAGFGLGALTASFLIPGVGPIAAIGFAAAALFGVAGGIGGATAGAAAEAASRTGIPADELYLYEHALSRGKGVLFVMVASSEEADKAKSALEASGAESLDAARKQWWVGIEELEQASSGTQPPRSESADTIYRRGFLTGLQPAPGDVSFETASARLRKELGDVVLQPAFRRGFERGREVAHDRIKELGAGARADRGAVA